MDIQRTNVDYWLSGGGQWSTRFESVSSDWLVACFVGLAILWLCIEQLIYSRRAFNSVHCESASQTHLRHQRRIAFNFQITSLAGLFAWVVPFVLPAYYLIGIAYLFCAVQSRLLNRSHLQLSDLEMANIGKRAVQENTKFRNAASQIAGKIDDSFEDCISRGQTLREISRQLRELAGD